MRLRTFAALGLLALAACSSSTNQTHPDADGGAGSQVGRTCNVDAECGGLRCDTVRRQCICLADTDCSGATPYCSNFTGLCVADVPGCKSNSDCAANQFCNPETRACQDLRGFCESCHADAECGSGNHCLADQSLGQSFCSKACGSQTDCPQGTTCTAIAQGDSQCLPNAGSNCKTFTGCTPDSLKSCNTNEDCANANNDQVCDVGSGVCRARVQICPLGTVCDPSVRVCVNSCSVDRDCSSDGSLACVNHLCQALSSCASDTDCPTDKVCDVPPGASGGTCVAFCTSDTSCGVGRVCQPVVEADGSTRQSCLPGCVHDTDCAPNEICLDQNGNVFVPSGTALGQCSNTYQGRPACQGTSSCASCDLCMADHTCQSAASLGFCHVCDPNRGNTDCSSFGAGSTCLSLGGRDANGNILGNGPFGCGVPCNPAGTADGASCPQGFVCAALTDANGNNTGVYNCVPSDFDCKLTASPPLCQ